MNFSSKICAGIFVLFLAVDASTEKECMFSGFNPYVGQNYYNRGPFGRRVLVLGESHYGGTENEYPEFTQWVVENFGRHRRHRFFTTVQKVIQGTARGHRLPDEQRACFWPTVAFYNYVQSIVGARPRARPTEEMWQGAQLPFLNLLEAVRPQILVGARPRA